MNYDDAEMLEMVLSMPEDPDYVGPPYRLALMAQEKRDQLQEALGIIDDLSELHDSYVGYLLAHNNYNERAAKDLHDRIAVLRLKQ